jgi:hypothetical protein
MNKKKIIAKSPRDIEFIEIEFNATTNFIIAAEDKGIAVAPSQSENDSFELIQEVEDYSFGFISKNSDRLTIDISNLDINFNGNKVSQLKFIEVEIFQNDPDFCIYYSIVLQIKTSTEKYHLLFSDSGKEKLQAALNQFFSKLDPRRIEYFLARASRSRNCKPLDFAYWDNWENVPSNHDEYTSHIYKLLLGKIETQVENRIDHHVSMLDMTGGKGFFAEMAINHLLSKYNNLTIQYHLVDLNYYSIKMAQERLLPLLNRFGTRLELSISTKSINGFSKSNETSFNIIISCGGVLNKEVVETQKEAADNMRLLMSQLKEHGQLIATGKTPLFSNKKEIEREGYSVQACSSFSQNYQVEASCLMSLFTQMYVITNQSNGLLQP